MEVMTHRLPSAIQMQQSTADLESKLVERLGKTGIPRDLIHKLATGGILKDDAACVLPQSEGQESSLQSLLSICLDADPLPINAKRLGEDLALCSAACFLSIWARLLLHPATNLIFKQSPQHIYAHPFSCLTLAWKHNINASSGAVTALQDARQCHTQHETSASNVEIEAMYTSRQLPVDSAKHQ